VSLNSYIAKQFSRPDGLGGKLISHIMNRQNQPLYDNTIRLMPISGSDSIIDIGCGNGYVLKLLASRFDCSLTGIDISKSIIEAASRRNRMYLKNGRMTLVCNDINGMPFTNHSFNKAYTINTVYFWDNPDSIMAEIFRILKPGGIFVNTLYTNETLSHFSHTHFGYKRFTVEQLLKAGIDAGFTVKIASIHESKAYSVIYSKA